MCQFTCPGVLVKLLKSKIFYLVSSTKTKIICNFKIKLSKNNQLYMYITAPFGRAESTERRNYV